jgi:hypothetical protein
MMWLLLCGIAALQLAILFKLGRILGNQEKIMENLSDVLKDMTDESTLIDGVSTLISGLEQQLKDALAGATLPPATQQQVDAVFAQAEANKAKLAAALAANTPAAAAAAAP